MNEVTSSALEPGWSQYLDLLKTQILNSLYHSDPEVERGRICPSFPTLTMIGRPRLDNIQNLLVDCIRRGVPGDCVEAGIWRGGAVALMAGVIRALGEGSDRRVVGVDSFQGIPPAKPEQYPADSAHIGCEKLPVVSDTSRSRVLEWLQRLDLGSDPRIEVIEGWFSDCLPRLAREGRRFSLVRVDGDTYESTIQALDSLEPCLEPGGYCIIDDYHSWEGCRAATDDYREKIGEISPLNLVDWTCVFWKKEPR